MANYYNIVITAPVFHGQMNEFYFCTSLYYTHTLYIFQLGKTHYKRNITL